MSEYVGDFSEVPLPEPISTAAAAEAAVRVAQGPSSARTADDITQWLNDVKDIEEGVTGDVETRRKRRDKRRARHMGRISNGLAASQDKLNRQMTRTEAQKICAQEVRVGFVGLFGGGLLAIFLKTLIGWAICRWLDWYFSSDEA